MASHSKYHASNNGFELEYAPVTPTLSALPDDFDGDDEAQRRRREERRKRKKKAKRGKTTSFEEGDPEDLLGNKTRQRKKGSKGKKRTRPTSWAEEIDELIDTGKARPARRSALDEGLDDVDA